jgi:RNA polymerase-binding transcription factor DksA
MNEEVEVGKGGNPIGEKWLEAMPYATLCIDCAEESEDDADLEAFDPNEH